MKGNKQMSTRRYRPQSPQLESGSSVKRACVYCGGTALLTKDHVPPKSIFSRPLPNDLITVPCCRKCNKSFEKDDQYFAILLSLRANMQESAPGRALLERNMRGLRRIEESKFRHYLRNSLTLFPVVSDGGIYLGNAPGIRIDFARLKCIMIRITKALAWINGVTCNSTGFSIYFFDWVKSKVLDDPDIQDIFKQFTACNLHGTKDQIFLYKYLTASGGNKYALFGYLVFIRKCIALFLTCRS